MKRDAYVCPQIEVVDICIESGFAATAGVDAQIEGFDREEWYE